MSFTNILPQNSIKRLLEVVLKNADPAVRDRLMKRYALGVKHLTSEDENKASKSYELLVTLVQELKAKELEVETTVTQLDGDDILTFLENLARLALGLAL